ncbi:MAG: ribonuclease HI [Armatimonadota bacterium]|nr:ribonuclease HI [Armatimonadota bacterium]
MIRIVTDGACSGNPGPGGWAALIIRGQQVEEIGGHEPHTTNNRMEMRAAIEALKRVPPNAPVLLITDSTYLKKGMTEWLGAWKARGWVTTAGTPVQNRDLWEELDRLAGTRVEWQFVRGHRGHPENEHANRIAQRYCQVAAKEGERCTGTRPPNGTLSAAPQGQPRPTPKPSLCGATGAWYVSLVHGEVRRHATWPACAARVKGVAGARFKKCRTEAEERDTLREWGVAP